MSKYFGWMTKLFYTFIMIMLAIMHLSKFTELYTHKLSFYMFKVNQLKIKKEKTIVGSIISFEEDSIYKKKLFFVCCSFLGGKEWANQLEKYYL